MSQEIKLGKTGFVRSSYINTIDTTFSQLIPPPPPVVEAISVEEFFYLYNNLFYEIPAEGSVNSHTFLIERSSEYIGFTEENDQNIQVLLDEITSLREELLQMKKDNELTQSFKSIKEKYDNPKQKRVVKEKPMIPHSSDDEFMNDEWWNDRIQRS